VFDKNDGWGGTLRDHEDFRLFDEDFALQFGAVDITWRFGCDTIGAGELAGFDVVHYAPDDGVAGAADSIAMGAAAAQRIEVFLKTGREDAAVPAKKDCSRHVIYDGAGNAPRIIPAAAGGYTEEEAMREAARCMQCDCTVCMDSCEMLGSFRKAPKRIAAEVYTDTQASSTFSSRSITRQTYSCNMCRHCESVCPEGVYIGELFAMSRRDRFSTGAAPYALHDFWLREMDFHTGAAKFFSGDNLGQASLPGIGETRYVFFPGCQLGAHNPAHVLTAYAYLRGKYNCGVYSGCCGAPAFWAGDQERFNANLASIRETVGASGDPVFIFACATCEALFAEYMPEIKGVSLYELLACDDGLVPACVFTGAAVFDPCDARGDGGMMDAVRALAATSGAALTELPGRNRCCGYGGLVRGGNPAMYDKVADARAEASESPYIVYCANCRAVFLSRGKDCAHILDMVFNLPVSMEVPAISERRRNSLFVVAELTRELKNEVCVPEKQPWDEIKLVIGKELREEIERKLISEDDLKETVWLAESSGEKFVDETDGSAMACLVRRALTYWVHYKVLQDGSIEILSAYYHRMSFSEE